MNDRIIRLLTDNHPKTWSIDELKETLKIESSDTFKALMKSVNQLVDACDVVEYPDFTIGLIEGTQFFKGTLDLKHQGYGFVITEQHTNDIFISPANIGQAMNKDVVFGIINQNTKGKKREGQILKVLMHSVEFITGVIKFFKNKPYIEPFDPTINRRVIVKSSHLNGARKNDVVKAHIINYDFRGMIDTVVTNIIGSSDQDDIQTLVKLIEYNIDPVFPNEVLEEANHIDMNLDDLDNRIDLRDELTITIDGDDAKDFDDAISLNMNEKNQYVLKVSIADVSYYVKEGSALDEEALLRGTSVYIPNQVIPMLPKTLSEGVCSLKPMEDRYTLTCEMIVDESGAVEDYQIYPSIIKSSYRMTYNQVNKILEGDKRLHENYVEVIGLIYQLRNLTKELKKRRFSHGSIDLHTNELKFEIIDGKVVSVHKRTQGLAENMIEECMLLANKTVAEHIYHLDLPFIYRVHDQPKEDVMTHLKSVIQPLGLKLHTQNGVNQKEMQDLLKEAHESDYDSIVQLLVLRSMQKAVYSNHNIGHYGLGFDYYTHFTSPIRRYPDLMVHRILRTFVFNQNYQEEVIKRFEERLPDISKSSSDLERNAMMLERDMDDIMSAKYMKNHIGDHFQGTITSITSFGIYITLENGVEGLAHVTSFPHYMVYVHETMTMIAEHTNFVYKIGQSVKIEVTDVDEIKGEIDFKVIKVII